MPVSSSFTEAARPYLMRGGYLLFDLQRDLDEEQLLARTDIVPAAKLAMLLLKIAPGNRDIDRDLQPWLGELAALRDSPRGKTQIGWIIRYILNVGDTPPDRVRAVFASLGPQVEEDFVSTLDMIRAEARAEVRAEDARALAETLTEVLAAKFGPVPAGVVTDVQSADGDQLRAWIRLAATGSSLDEVFPDRK